MSLKPDLIYKVSSTGKELTLKPVPPLLLQRFLQEWKKRNPHPTPPPREMVVGDEHVLVPNSSDPYYVDVLVPTWEESYGAAQVDFFLYYGVIDNPPDGWIPDDIFYSGDLTKIERKSIWVSEFLEAVEDITEITEAIQSINMVTDKGLLESKNGLAQPQVVLTSLAES